MMHDHARLVEVERRIELLCDRFILLVAIIFGAGAAYFVEKAWWLGLWLEIPAFFGAYLGTHFLLEREIGAPKL